MNVETAAQMYNFCIAGVNDECTRGYQHDGSCDPPTDSDS